MPPDDPSDEVREEAWSYARRFLSVGLQCLSLVIWALVQIALAFVRRYLPDDVLTQATFITCLVLEAGTTLCWTGMHTYRELRIFFIRAQADIRLEQEAARHRLEQAAHHRPQLPRPPEE